MSFHFWHRIKSIRWYGFGLWLANAVKDWGLRARNEGLNRAWRVIEGSVHMNQENIPTLDMQTIAQMLPRRNRDANKGDFGRLLVLCGSKTMPGALYLCAMGALRGGAGLTTIATAAENVNRLCAALPEAMWLPLETDDQGFLRDSDNNRRALSPALERAGGVVLGCGLGVTDDTIALTLWVLLQAVGKRVVLDADGLNCMAHSKEIAALADKNWILTPHPGEMARLSGKTVREIQSDRTRAARTYAAGFPGVLVLKGAGTLVAQGDRICCNPTGNPGMSRGGSGDVLAGLLAGLALGGVALWAAACIGVFMHGYAGDLAARASSEQAMLARDLLAALPRAFLEVEKLRD